MKLACRKFKWNNAVKTAENWKVYKGSTPKHENSTFIFSVDLTPNACKFQNKLWNSDDYSEEISAPA